ncbi:MAG: HDIG domain-containing protein [Deltaproteobacteria bacterium]|nr:MAG: HDIG domain-containing protein [Deltaproteobacteria bacterium]
MTTSTDGVWRRLMRRRRFRAVLQLAVLVAVAASASFLLTPSRVTPAIPGDDSLGQIASATIRAPRDFDVRDREATAQKREEAARSVWAVYDFDLSAGDVLRQRIASAFAQGRAAIEEWKRQNPEKAARLLERGKRRSPEQDELVRGLLGQRDEFWKALQAVMDEEDYLELARAGFDPAVERAADPLVEAANRGYAVAERELLAADRERGIVVRSLPGDPRAFAPGSAGPYGTPERQMGRDEIDRVRDLAQVRADIDRAAQERLPQLSPQLRHAVAQAVRRATRPNLAYDDAETRRRQDEKRAAVKEAVLQIRRGERIIEAGEPITKTHLLIFQAMRASGRAASDEQVRWGGALFAALICFALYVFARRNVRRFRLRTRDVVMLAAVLGLQLLAVRGSLVGAEALRDLLREKLHGVYWTWAGEALLAAVPYAAGSMLVRLLLTSEAALVWTAGFAPLCGVMVGSGLQPAVLALVSGVVAADRVAHARTRGAVFQAGLWTSAASVCVLASFALFQGRIWTMETAAALAGAVLGGALVVPLLVLLVAPAFEWMFGYVTDIQLRELANFNHPLLKDLIVQAPGTYHHGIVIGAMVDAAAMQIGANPLLARVGAYYHDIGKGKNPLFFGENQKGENRHEAIEPQMSARLIHRHVTDGVELARKAKLPQAVIDFILQHHGTRLIGYFFHKAKEEAERKGEPPPSDAHFRYAGPKPQSREAALVMIGDMVVATSRNVTGGDAATLRQLVDKAIQQIASDGQLVECELTMRDLDLVAGSFAGTLHGIYSARPEVPPDARPPLRVLESVPARVAGK